MKERRKECEKRERRGRERKSVRKEEIRKGGYERRKEGVRWEKRKEKE